MDLEAAVHQTHGDAPEHWDPDIRIEKVTSVLPTNVNRTGAHHDRVPDIGLSIRAFIATGTATEHAVVTEYAGEYIGHGQSKTVFKLHCLRESGTFDGCILKVRKTKRDLEPSVFTRLRDYGITTNILYQARGLECSIDDFFCVTSFLATTAGLQNRQFQWMSFAKVTTR